MQRFREPWSSVTHLAAIPLAAAGLVYLLVLSRGDPLRMATMAIYGTSLLLTFSASTALHVYQGPQRTIDHLNRLDHAVIYFLIAGSYTPICANALSGFWREGMLIIVWTLAVIGALYKLLAPGFNDTLSTGFYLGMGWMAVGAFPQILRTFPAPAIVLLVAGGIFYTTGAIFYSLENRATFTSFGWHELWHLAVIAGSGLHFWMIARYVAA